MQNHGNTEGREPNAGKSVEQVRKQEVFIDYYMCCNLDRNAKTSEIFDKLQRDIGKFSKLQSDGSLNDPSLFEDIVEFLNMALSAAPHFRNDERRKKYDKKLNEAYEKGLVKVDEAREKTINDIFDRLEESFTIGNYQFVIDICHEAISKDNIHDYKIYEILAKAYFYINELDLSFEAIENGLKANPDNLTLLKRGARQSVDGGLGVNKAQEYINRMTLVDEDNPLTVSEQVYLYLRMSKKDDAFSTIDKYIEAYPANDDFRQMFAQELIAYSTDFYIKDISIESVKQTEDGLALASRYSYETCLEVCNKAASICDTKATADALNMATKFGQTEFNTENINGLLSLSACGVMYCCTGFGIPIGLLLFFCAWRLYQLSYRPYWQINKYYLTGEREPKERRYIRIGKFFTWYLEFSVKAVYWLFHILFRLLLWR